MKCKDSKRYIYQMLDGETPDEVKAGLIVHLEECSACQAEYKSIEAFQRDLKSEVLALEPSVRFERVFWQKVLERQKEPWIQRVFQGLESFFPVPSLSQMAAALLFSFIIGSTTGVFAAMKEPAENQMQVTRNSIQYLSGFPEYKGLPSVSVAGAYLKASQEGNES
jgi:anti-sigma factor RsiW